MILPSKIEAGTPIARTRAKINEMIDYLQSIRLVRGPGILLRAHPGGIVIEATTRGASGGGSGAGDGGTYDGPFAVSRKVSENKDEDENRNLWHVNGGIVRINGWGVEIAQTDLTVTAGQAVILTVELDSSAPRGVVGGMLSAGTPWPEKSTQESLTVALIKEDDDGNLTVEQQVYGTPLMLLTGTCK